MHVRRLVRLYPHGYIYQGPYPGGRTVVEFDGDKTYGLDFTLEDVKNLTFKPKGGEHVAHSRADWQRLLRANPRVVTINVSGE